jgi:hypothetical protein
MRTLSVLALTTLLAVPVAAQGNPADPDKKAAGTGTVPAGWSFRLDKATDSIKHVKFVTMEPGFHFTTGPSGIFWRAADAVPGSFHTVATFSQTQKPAHPEAFGLFVAGKDLNGAGASYVYLLVRGDGMYTIRKGGAVGAPSTNLTTGGNRNGWLASDAVVKEDAAGKSKNVLEVEGNAATKKLIFKVNGKAVGEVDAPDGSVAGLVGIRMNHNLDVHVQGFEVHKIG